MNKTILFFCGGGNLLQIYVGPFYALLFITAGESIPPYVSEACIPPICPKCIQMEKLNLSCGYMLKNLAPQSLKFLVTPHTDVVKNEQAYIVNLD